MDLNKHFWPIQNVVKYYRQSAGWKSPIAIAIARQEGKFDLSTSVIDVNFWVLSFSPQIDDILSSVKTHNSDVFTGFCIDQSQEWEEHKQ